jgi:hypothetical protein
MKGVFMKSRLISIFIPMLIIFIGCSVIKKNETITDQQNNTDVDIFIDLEPQDNNDYIADSVLDTYESVHNNITDFFFVEIMDGNMGLSFHRDDYGKYGVKDIFGEPLDIIATSTSFYFEGGIVIEIRQLVYDDFIHNYYVFENGVTFYQGFIIEKRLERLKTINIGDTSDKLLSTFSDGYFTSTRSENIIYYTDPVTCEIEFVIKDKVIQKIYVNYLLI